MKEMTKERLEEYRSNKAEIKEIEYNLKHRWENDCMLGVDTILNYNKGYPVPEGVIGFDTKKYERLQERDLKRKAYLEKECAEIERFIENIEKSTIRRIFQMYFTEGPRKQSQESIARKVHVDRSSISKKINAYLKVSQNSQKSHL